MIDYAELMKKRRPAMKFTEYFTRHLLFNLLQQQVKYNILAISLRIVKEFYFYFTFNIKEVNHLKVYWNTLSIKKQYKSTRS